MKTIELKDVKDIVTAGMLELKNELAEIKQENADLEAKMANHTPIAAGGEMKFDTKAASAALKTAMQGDRQVEVKALTIAGADGESLAIDDELGRTVIERARENVAILNLIGSKSVGSVNYRELVLRNYPTVGETGENTTLAGADWSATDTQTYEEVVMKVGKQYAKPQVSDEAVNDPHVDLYAALERLLADEIGRYWAKQVLAGDGSANQINGILFDDAGGTIGHMDTRDATDDGTKGESWKSNDVRNPTKFPVLPTGVAGAFPATSLAFMDLLIDATVAIPSNYLASASWTLNRRTLGKIRKLRDGEERPLIQFEMGSFSLLGHAITVEDYMPNEAADSFPIIFGDLKKAYALCDIDSTYLLDPYSVDGAVQIKSSIRKGSLVQNNDAIIVIQCTDSDGE
jgi:HK97 family phage major capsid protein